MRTAGWISIVIMCGTAATVGCRRPAETATSGSRTTPSPAFSYEKQVGMVGAVVGGGVGCLAIFNDSLKPGATVVLVDQPPVNQPADRPAVEQASIVERISEPCDDHLSSSHDVEGQEYYYRVRAGAADSLGSGYWVAVVDPQRTIEVRDGKAVGDIDGDGSLEYFRACPSNEGVHYQIWTGPPLEGRGRWHWYVYAGYDLEYACSENEYFGPK